jgi:uncharacterized protein YaaN involved in tellurite resistance
MAKTAKTTVIESEVKKTRKRPANVRKTPTRTKRAVDEISSEAEEELTKGAIMKRVEDSGEVNTRDLTPARKAYYKEIASVLNEKDITSISSYGSDLQKAMDSYSSDFLKQSFDSKAGLESAQLLSNLLGELHEVDINDLETPNAFKRFLRKIPGLKRLVISVEQIKAKYNTIEKNIDGIVKKLEATRQIAIRDNNLLQKQFENNCDYVDQLEDLIVAGKMKSEEVGALVGEMKTRANEYEEYQISDIEEFKNSLDKRLSDLIALRFAFKQSLTQIRIIQRTNIIHANNTESQIAMTIPLWKNQLSLAVALYDQKQAIDVSTKVTDTTNELMRKNAEMMKTQSIEVAKQSQRMVIDPETLQKATQELIATVEGVQKAQKEGAEKRAAAEAQIAKLEKEMHMKAIGLVESTQKVIASELRGKKPIELIG